MVIGRGISSAVSLTARPNIMPWSPAPWGLSPLAPCVDADGDVRGLLLEGDQDAGGVAVEAVLGLGVADLVDGLADDVADLDVALGGDFAGDHGQAARQQGLDGDAAAGVLATAVRRGWRR